ncbi:uncharacterized protein DUF3192 [Balneicella halophila]|uniref:Uncharacterized protein DUF3192 n=1 Tax=Balneicella halophila TaxID=1537566 RepID=A0A7L4UMD5_BALHA|nr:DUF3192 domain-containing protein [Balneicella halophila]PVX48807.1 uncharacterized protein DUF3192 [Balneicella halophila]
MKYFIYTGLILILTGCMSTEAIRTANRENINRISMGISKTEVLNIMGSQTITAGDGTKVNNPWRSEILKGDNDEYYEVLFYYTDLKGADGAITDDELTPIILKDNKVIGWGWSFLNENVKKYHINTR